MNENKRNGKRKSFSCENLSMNKINKKDKINYFVGVACGIETATWLANLLIINWCSGVGLWLSKVVNFATVGDAVLHLKGRIYLHVNYREAGDKMQRNIKDGDTTT